MKKDNRAIYIPEKINMDFADTIREVESEFRKKQNDGYIFVAQYGESRLFSNSEDAKYFGGLLKKAGIDYSVNDSSEHFKSVTKDSLTEIVMTSINNSLFG